MEHLHSIALVIGLFLLGVISPGPNFLIVTQQSLTKGFKAGAVTGLGIASGDCIYAFAGLFGLTFLMSLTGWVFGLVKILGGIYLIYLGIRMLLTKHTGPVPGKDEKPLSFIRCYRLGLLTDLSNPKTILFFAGIFATAIKPMTPQWALTGMLTGIVATSILWRIALSFLFSRTYFRTTYLRFNRRIEFVFGAMLTLFGLKLTSTAILQAGK